MNFASKKHFVFDLDDTITESYAFNQDMFVRTFEPYLSVEHPEIQQHIRSQHAAKKGTSMFQQFAELVDHFGLTVSAEELVQSNEQLHVSHIEQIEVYDVMLAVFSALRVAKKNMSICTNRQTESLHRILQHHGIGKHFSFVISCTDAGHEKPDPYCLLELMRRSGNSPEDFIYFGDSKTDELFAQNAGVDFALVDHTAGIQVLYQGIVNASQSLPPSLESFSLAMSS